MIRAGGVENLRPRRRGGRGIASSTFFSFIFASLFHVCSPFTVTHAVLGEPRLLKGFKCWKSYAHGPRQLNTAYSLRMSQDERHEHQAIEPVAAVAFDSVTGYGDMTGFAKFDDAWVEAYRKKDRIRCPFWRRRTVDMLEVVLHMARFLLARHKSLDVFPPARTGLKTVGLTLSEVASVVQRDFKQGQYYVTGRLSKGIYADDCYFDAPDPDMPVRGLRKYVDAISHLFEHKSSRVDLLSIEELPERNAIIARWRLEGTLMLPWRPIVRPYTGVTLYEVNEQGLIYRHTELWSIPVVVAFLSAVVSLDNQWARRLGVPAPTPSVDELLKMPAGEQTPDPAPLLKRGENGILSSLLSGNIWGGSSTSQSS